MRITLILTSKVGLAGGVSSVASGQAAIATENVLSHRKVTEGLGDPEQMGGDFILGAAASMATYGVILMMSASSKRASI